MDSTLSRSSFVKYVTAAAAARHAPCTSHPVSPTNTLARPAPTTYRWYVVAVCTIAYVFSFIDRQIMTLLIEPVSADLGLNDTQFALLHGLAFALFYATMGIPIAHLSDRHSRPLIIAAGVFVWSIATAVCGLAQTFWQLFIARIAVGTGEATLSPATYSMLADYFPKEQLGRAVAVYSTGSFIGAGLAFLAGGALIALVPQLGLDSLPLVGTLRPWQATFVLVGLPGVIVALLFAVTVRDPERRDDSHGGHPIRGANPGAQNPTFADVLAFCATHRGAILSHFIGYSFASMALYQLLAWGPAIFIRAWGFSAAQSGLLLGTVTLVASTTGVLASGWLNDWLRQRGRRDAPMLAGAIGGAGIIVPIAWLPAAESLSLAVALFGAALFFASFPMPPSTAAIQLLAPNRMRSRISAMFLFCNSLFGLALGSALVGTLNDRVFGRGAAVTTSVALVVGGSAVVTTIVLLVGMRPFRESLGEP
jgi:MFS family permease